MQDIQRVRRVWIDHESFIFRRSKFDFLTCAWWLVFVWLIGVSTNTRTQVTSTPVRWRLLNPCRFLITIYIRTVSPNINCKSAICCIIKTSKSLIVTRKMQAERFLRNVGTCLTNCTASRLRGPESPWSSPVNIQGSRLSSLCSWGLRSSAMLRSVGS